MYSELEFTWENAHRLVDILIYEITLKHLSDAEVQVLRGSWEGKTYDAIASEFHLSRRRIEEIGEDLWTKLSNALGEQVRKTNFRQALQRQWEKRGKLLDSTFIRTDLPQKEAHKAFATELYEERPPIESSCYQEICKPGALLRIKAPWQTGKTELMSKIIHYAEQKGYRTVVLNLRDATKEDFSNLDKFLQWFCTIIAHRFELTASVDEHWRKSIGNSKIKCRSYFEKYLLPLDSPLILALDEVDRIFPIQEIASEFLGMLRTWHEDAKTRQLWQQLRLVVLHSEIYTEVDINQSPFNAGYEMTLTDFNENQVLSLAQRYGLNWDAAKVTQLMAVVGGHPYLVGEALKQIAQQDATLSEVLQTSHTPWGIYSRHLERHGRNLQSNPELASAFQKIVQANSPVEFNAELNQTMAVKLNDLGLVKLLNNSVMPRYELYRQYFRERLLT
jgi:AAA-like domain